MERLRVFEHATRQRLWMAAGAAAVLLAASYVGLNIYRSSVERDTTTLAGPEVNLLQEQTWDMAGVTQQADGLHVASTDMAIVNQDGSPGHDNPPVNLTGTYLEVHNNFRVSATIRPGKGKSELTLYGQPPIISDESRADVHALKLTMLPNNMVDVNLTNGEENSKAVFHKTYKLPENDTNLSVTRKDGRLLLAASGVEFASIAEHDLFDGGQVWFGLSAPSGGAGWVLSRLVAAPLIGSELKIKKGIDVPAVHMDGQGLNALAQKKRSDFRIGGAFALGPLVSDKNYAQLALGGNFGSMTPENAMKWQFIHPKPDEYTFQEADALVNIATARGIDVHGHALVFGEANPAWLQELARNHPEQLEQAMVNHITTVVGHFKGRVKSWDVINEPMVEGNIWQKVMGRRYIEVALRAAHAADPDAELWINDYGMEFNDARFNQAYALVKPLKDAGVPITGIGFQSHFDEEDMRKDGRSIDANALQRRFQVLGALDLKARISELDVSSDEQLAAIPQVVGTCLGARNCSGVTFWGVSDKYSSAATVNGNTYEPGTGLPWDERYKSLPVVADMRKLLTK